MRTMERSTKKSGTRACSVSMKRQGMQSDNIMKCDEPLQQHVKPVQFKGRGLPKTMGKAWFQLVTCKGPSTLKKKKSLLQNAFTMGKSSRDIYYWWKNGLYCNSINEADRPPLQTACQ